MEALRCKPIASGATPSSSHRVAIDALLKTEHKANVFLAPAAYFMRHAHRALPPGADTHGIARACAVSARSRARTPFAPRTGAHRIRRSASCQSLLALRSALLLH